MTDRELDLLVAQHVMDLPAWLLHTDDSAPRVLTDPDTGKTVGPVRAIECYSTTGDGLLAVIEKMRERLCTPHILIGAKHTFATFLAPENMVAHDPFKDQSAPRAVAIAALRALGVEL